MYFVLELARGGDLFTVQSAQPNYMLPEARARQTDRWADGQMGRGIANPN
jgi:hypothetical protein